MALNQIFPAEQCLGDVAKAYLEEMARKIYESDDSLLPPPGAEYLTYFFVYFGPSPHGAHLHIATDAVVVNTDTNSCCEVTSGAEPEFKSPAYQAHILRQAVRLDNQHGVAETVEPVPLIDSVSIQPL